MLSRVKETALRICIYGAGSIGGYIALKLAFAGHEVSVVARGDHLDAIRSNGLELRFDDNRTPLRARVAASDRPAELGPQDAVLVTLKATAVAAIARDLPPLLRPETAVAFLQNGMPWWYGLRIPAHLPKPPDLGMLDPGGRLAALLGERHVMGGIAYPSNEVIAPGVVRTLAASRNDVLLAEIDGSATQRLAALRAALEQAGIPSPPVADIRHTAWNKLLINASVSTLCALAGHPMTILDRDPALRAIARRGFGEVLAIAAAHGMSFAVDPESIFGAEKRFTPHNPSILQDRQRGRPMEIDALLMAPLAFARAARVPAPTLETIAALLARVGADAGTYTLQGSVSS
jgi:2-dehydropantoate 2-reductase